MNADPSGYLAGFPHLAEPTSEMLSCRGDALYIEGVDVVALADRVATPFFLFSATQIDRNIAALRDSFRQFHPATRVFYASKACSNLWFLDRVRRAGIDIEVNSGGELWKARKAGFEPRQIIFNGVAKTRAEVAAALEGPIEALVVDSVFELRRVADVAADLRKQARVALRVYLNVVHVGRFRPVAITREPPADLSGPGRRHFAGRRCRTTVEAAVLGGAEMDSAPAGVGGALVVRPFSLDLEATHHCRS